MAKMTASHFIFLADKVAPMLPWPSSIIKMAEELAATNPKFKKDRFIARATAAWEAANPMEPLNDDIPY